MRPRNVISKSLVVGFLVGITSPSAAIGLAQWFPQ
jgi:hypothetical protein